MNGCTNAEEVFRKTWQPCPEPVRGLGYPHENPGRRPDDRASGLGCGIRRKTPGTDPRTGPSHLPATTTVFRFSHRQCRSHEKNHHHHHKRRLYVMAARGLGLGDSEIDSELGVCLLLRDSNEEVLGYWCSYRRHA